MSQYFEEFTKLTSKSVTKTRSMFKCLQASLFLVSGLHIFLGLLSIGLGIISSLNVDVWLDHTVSPIWSGGFFCISGSVGLWFIRRRSSYLIICFAAFSMVSVAVAVVSMQLLRVALVIRAADGNMFLDEQTDAGLLIYLCLAIAGTEILVCLVSIVISCGIARVSKDEHNAKKNGLFYVKVLGQKDVIMVTKPVDDTDELIAV